MDCTYILSNLIYYFIATQKIKNISMKNLFGLLIMVLTCFSLSAQYCPGGGGGGTGGGGGGGTGAGASFTGGGSGGTISFNSNAFGQQFTSQIYSLVGKSKSTAYKGVKGSPYLNDEPIKGTLVLNNGNMIQDILLQMDLYTNEVVATKKDGEEVILDNIFFREVIIPFEGEDIVYKKTNPEDPDNFYEVLYEGPDMVFFKQRDVALREGHDHGISKIEPKFSQRNKYYIKHGEGAVATVKLKKKENLSGFADAELYAMKEFARQNGLKFKDESDYIAIFEGIYEGETLED